jgi:hypothetical protein
MLFPWHYMSIDLQRDLLIEVLYVEQILLFEFDCRLLRFQVIWNEILNEQELDPKIRKIKVR